MADPGRLGNPRYDLDDDASFPEQVTEVSDWAAAIAVPKATSRAQVNTLYPSPKHGDMVRALFAGQLWFYYGAYDASTNPGGSSPAGWTPIAGRMPKARVTQDTDGPIPKDARQGIMTVPIVDAPAGTYEYTFTIIVSVAAPTRGEVRVVHAGGIIDGPIPFDHPGPVTPSGQPTIFVRLGQTYVGHYRHAGGDLRVGIDLYLQHTTGTIHQRSIGTLKYLGPSVALV